MNLTLVCILRVFSVIFTTTARTIGFPFGFYCSIYHLHTYVFVSVIYRHFSIDKQPDVNMQVHIFVDCSVFPAFKSPRLESTPNRPQPYLL